jgi:hypothetical protein
MILLTCVCILVGRIVRYAADVNHPLLYDDRGRRYNPDPDFSSNRMPVWAICGPDIRRDLRRGDVLFFTPKKSRQPREWNESGNGYQCTGYLTVLKKRDSNVVLSDRRLSLAFRDRYRRDLTRHQTKDTDCCKRTDRIAPLFAKNFVYGYRIRSGRSKWLGRNGPSLVLLLRRCGLHKLAKAMQTGIYNPNLPRIPDERVRQLMRLLRKHTRTHGPARDLR